MSNVYTIEKKLNDKKEEKIKFLETKLQNLKEKYSKKLRKKNEKINFLKKKYQDLQNQNKELENAKEFLQQKNLDTKIKLNKYKINIRKVEAKKNKYKKNLTTQITRLKSNSNNSKRIMASQRYTFINSKILENIQDNSNREKVFPNFFLKTEKGKKRNFLNTSKIKKNFFLDKKKNDSFKLESFQKIELAQISRVL